MSNGPNPTNTQKALVARAQALFGVLPANVAALKLEGKLNDDLAGGITGGFAIVTLRGKVWRIKYRGEEKVMENEQGEPRYSLEVILVKSSDTIAKVFYEEGYVEGSTAPPDCWSVDGKVPDPASPSLVAKRTGPTCAGCWANAWGSRTGVGTGKGKACADNKRLAIVPLEDPKNEFFGGPMLLRIPPASLGDVKSYADALAQMGYPYFAVATRISFDLTAEFPRVTFKPIRALTEEEAAVVLEQRDSDSVDRILNTAIDQVETGGTDKTHGLEFEQPPAAQQQPVPRPSTPMAPAAPKPAPRPAQPGPAPVQQAPKPAPAPAQTPTPENTPKVTRAEGPAMNNLLPEGWVGLPGGKFYHAEHGVTDHIPEPKALEPKVELIALPDGNFYNSATGEVVRAQGKPTGAAPTAPVATAPQPEPASASAPKATRARKTKEEPKEEPKQLALVPDVEDGSVPSDEGAETPPDFESILDGMLGSS